jgi:L-seryl-tRNA(Ser) seleniumtransferase
MVATPVADLAARADRIVAAAGLGTPVATEALPGAGSAPGVTMPSFGIELAGDHLAALRSHTTPVIARVRDDRTALDLRTVDPTDDVVVIEALGSLVAS